MRNPEDLREAQQLIIDQLYENNHRLVVADMGAGKTAATLTAAAELLEDGILNRILVLAPLRVATSVWDAEIEQWSHLRGLTISRAVGNVKQRLAALLAGTQIVTMNYENIQWLFGDDKVQTIDGRDQLVRMPPAVPFYRLGFDGLVLDEVSRMKGGHKSKRFKCLKRHLDMFKWRVGLTGTPASNGLTDLWGASYVIDRGEALGRTVTAFRKRYFLPIARPTHIEYVPQHDAEERIYNDLAKSAYVLDPNSYDAGVDEPEIVPYNVPLNEHQIAAMAELKKDFMDPNSDSPIANAGVLSGAWHQITQGFRYINGADSDVVSYSEAKLEAAWDLVQTLRGNPVVICYKFREDLLRLRGVFENAPNLGSGTSAAMGDKIIKQWNAGKVPVLLLHPASAGHGLNLQHGGHHMIWYGLTWAEEEYEQAIARLARPGQTKQVYVHLLMSGPYDAGIRRALSGKRNVEKALIDGLLERQ